MAEKNLEDPGSLLASLSSSKFYVGPEVTAGTNEYDNSNLQNKETASFEESMQEELPASLIGNKSNLQDISTEQKAPISDSATPSSEVDSGFVSARDPHGSPMTSHRHDESTEPNSDSTTILPLEENTHSTSETYDRLSEVVQAQTTPLDNIQDDAFCSDSTKVACETPPALPAKVKAQKPHLMHRFHERQMSLRDTRQKPPAPLNRSNSGKYFRTDNTIVDTTTHIESVKVAASRFGGSINWKTRRTEPEQENGHVILELDRLKKEISECKAQVEAAEAAKVSVCNEYEKTKRVIEGLEHDLEKAQEEEICAKLYLEFFFLIVNEMEEGVTSDDCVIGCGQKLNMIKEQYNAVLTNLMLVKDESRKMQENYQTLLIEQDIAIRKSQEAVAESKDAARKVELLTVELNKLNAELELAHSKCHDAEKHSIGTSLARDEDSLKRESDLRQAEEELNQLVKKISSVEELKSMLDTSTGLFLKLSSELAAYVEAKPNEEAQENITERSMHDKTISPTRDLECLKGIDKVRDKVCDLNVAAGSLKTELTKEKAELATLQQMEAMSSITAASLKMEIQLAQKELETVQTKEKESRNGMLGLQKIMEDTAKEVDAAKSIAKKAQVKLRKAKEDMEHAKAGLNTIKFRLQAVLKEMEAAKESEKLALAALRSLESDLAVDIEEQGSEMITINLDEYQSLAEKSGKVEELVREKTDDAIAQVNVAKESESRVLLTLSETYKVLEQRKQALLAAIQKADRATEGKLAVEQELRKWREENEQRRKAGEASKSELKPSSTSVIIAERSGDTKGTSKDDSYASVHPLLDLSAKSSPNDSALLVKMKKRKKLSFFPRIIMFFTRKRLRAVK